MGDEVECITLSADAQEVLAWLQEVIGATEQEAVELALKEGIRLRRAAQQRNGTVIPFRRPGKAEA